jgi:hypothetical protein
MAQFSQLGTLGRLATPLALACLSAMPAHAAKNSAPAQVMMVATMPPTFSLQAAQASVAGSVGTVQVQSGGHGHLLIYGQLRGQGGAAVVRIPVSLASNTRSFMLQALAEGATSHATIYLESPEIMARRMPMRSPTALGMAMAKDRRFFALNQPVHSTLEIVIEKPAFWSDKQFPHRFNHAGAGLLEAVSNTGFRKQQVLRRARRTSSVRASSE